jgi:glycine/D-amino acid oxidase-like deaminating enzyme
MSKACAKSDHEHGQRVVVIERARLPAYRGQRGVWRSAGGARDQRGHVQRAKPVIEKVRPLHAEVSEECGGWWEE